MVRTIRLSAVAVLSLVWLTPLYLLLVNANAPVSEFSVSNLWQPPGSFHLVDNIKIAFNAAGFSDTNIADTVLYAVVSPLIAVAVASLAGYAIVVLRVRGARTWFVLLFGATIIPLQMLAAPLFLGYGRTHLFDTRFGLILIYSAVSIPFATFVMRNVFGQVPREIYEASQIDGASRLRIFFQQYLPLSRSALIAVFVLQFTFVWNDLFLGLTLSTNLGAQGVTPALAGLHSAYGGASYPVVLAGAIATALPTVVLFLVTQRFFASGLSLGQV